MIVSFPLKEEDLQLKNFLSLFKEDEGGGEEEGQRSSMKTGNYII